MEVAKYRSKLSVDALWVRLPGDKTEVWATRREVRKEFDRRSRLVGCTPQGMLKGLSRRLKGFQGFGENRNIFGDDSKGGHLLHGGREDR